jgi:hypothetical protein
MIEDAHRALLVLMHGGASVGDDWISAFADVQWVERSEAGPVLTAAGREACLEMSRRLAAKADPPRRRRRRWAGSI